MLEKYNYTLTDEAVKATIEAVRSNLSNWKTKELGKTGSDFLSAHLR